MNFQQKSDRNHTTKSSKAAIDQMIQSQKMSFLNELNNIPFTEDDNDEIFKLLP